jgi:hypothetical protein
MRLSPIYRDQAIRSLPLWLVHSSVTASVLVGLVAFFHAAGHRQLPLPVQTAFALCGWFLIMTWLLLGRVRIRAGEMDLALPLSGSRLWLCHVVAVTLAGLAILTVAGAVLAVHAWLLVRIPGDLLSELNTWALALQLVAVLVLTVALLEGRRLDQQILRLERSQALWMVLGVPGSLVLVVVLSLLSPVWALLPVALGVMLMVLAYRSAPSCLSLSASSSGDEDPGVGERQGWRTRGGFLLILRIAYYSPKVGQATLLITVPFLALMGAVLGGALGALVGEDMFAYLYMPLIAMMLVSFVAPLLEMLAPLDPLPVSRRRIFALLTLPSVGVVALSYGLGLAVPERGQVPRELVHYRESEKEGHFYLYVPIGGDEITRAGEAPKTKAPWGEAHEAWKSRLFRGSPLMIYNPYHTPKGSSLEYVAWQISRAVEKVYGRAIPPDQIASRYLMVRDDGSVGLKTETLSLRADNANLEPLSPGPRFPVTMALTVVPFYLGLAVILRFLRSGHGENKRKGILFAFVGLAVAVIVLQVVGMIGGFAAPWALQALVEIPTRKLGASHLGVMATWIVSLALVAGSYLLAERLFNRAELPAKASQSTGLW